MNWKQFIGSSLVLGIFFSSCYVDNSQDLYQYYEGQCSTDSISYSLDIQPIMAVNCVSCHQGTSPSGNVSLTNYDEVKVTGLDGSLLGCVQGVGFSLMPPSGKMSNCNISKIDQWIKNGLPNN